MFLNDTGRLEGLIRIKVQNAKGQVKKLFNYNKLGFYLAKKYGAILPRIPLLFGYWNDAMEIHNIICNTGKGQVTALMGSMSTAGFTYLAVGSNSTAAAATDTTLGAEITTNGLARASATVTQVTTTTTNDTLQLVHQWTATGAQAVYECGAFNASSSGTILGHQVFSVLSLANGDTLQCTYSFKQS